MTEPTLTQRSNNLGWIASTPPGHRLRVAVFAPTRATAVVLFAERLAVWETIGCDTAAPKETP